MLVPRCRNVIRPRTRSRQLHVPLLRLGLHGDGQHKRAADFIKLDNGSEWAEYATPSLLLRESKIDEARQAVKKMSPCRAITVICWKPAWASVPTPKPSSWRAMPRPPLLRCPTPKSFTTGTRMPTVARPAAMRMLSAPSSRITALFQPAARSHVAQDSRDAGIRPTS